MNSISTELLDRENLATEGVQVPEWNVRPFQLVSLLEMIPFLAGLLYAIGMEAQMFEDSLLHQQAKRGSDDYIESGEAETARQLIEHLFDECERVELKRAMERLADLAALSPRLDSVFTLQTFVLELGEIQKAIMKDLADRLFLFVPLDQSVYHEHGKHRIRLLSADAEQQFPEANKELVEAGNCYATDNYTACVFHCMRAVEVGARVMVNALRARKYLNPPNRPVELCTWNDLLEALDKGVADLAAGTRTDPRKKAKYEFYNHAVAQFRNFKDAWRNNVSHKRETYQQGKAKDIMDNTRQFMQHLAERLREAKREKK